MCTDAAQWEAWLAAHHEQQCGVWLKIAKKGSGTVSITLLEALDIALCYGWIDSQRKAYDTAYYLQRYSPRRAKSPWSKLNVERVETLMAVGRVRAPGLAEVLAATGATLELKPPPGRAIVPRDMPFLPVISSTLTNEDASQ